ncbi:MAG: hypothetical protein ACK40X_12915, partial [Armatimonadota bacterium]
MALQTMTLEEARQEVEELRQKAIDKPVEMLSREEAEQEAERLRKELTIHCWLYYVLNSPII